MNLTLYLQRNIGKVIWLDPPKESSYNVINLNRVYLHTAKNGGHQAQSSQIPVVNVHRWLMILVLLECSI